MEAVEGMSEEERMAKGETVLVKGSISHLLRDLSLAETVALRYHPHE